MMGARFTANRYGDVYVGGGNLSSEAKALLDQILGDTLPNSSLSNSPCTTQIAA